MTAENLFRKYKTLCVYFEEAEEKSLKEYLSSLGYTFPAEIQSPILIHDDKTISFISGFAAAVLYSLPEKELNKYRPAIKKLNFAELSAPEVKSRWYETRKYR